MTKLRIGGPSAPGVLELQQVQAHLKVTLDKEDALLRTSQLTLPPMGAKASAPDPAGMKILQAEMDNPKSLVDWTRFASLREGGADAFQQAHRAFKAACGVETAVIDLNRALPKISTLDTVHEIGWFLLTEARDQYSGRMEILERVDRVIRMVEAAPDAPGVAGFPKAALNALRNQLQLDLEDLLHTHGPEVKKPRRTFDAGLGNYKPAPPKPKFLDPTPAAQLPARVALTAAEVTDLKDAAKGLERLLKAPGLEAKILAFAERQGNAEHQLIKVLGAFTLLADEATTAPDYRYIQGNSLPDRAHYRARFHAKPSSRNDTSRQVLLEALAKVMDAKDPVAAGEKVVVDHFLREIGFTATEIKNSKASFDSVSRALEDEAFLPLRYLNEYEIRYQYKAVSQEMKQLFRKVTTAFVEGRFEEWKANQPAAEWQLRSLTPEGRAAWHTPLETQREIKDSKGQPVVLKTHEARGFERLWVTKNHTGSHGFDHPIGTPCLLAYLTNPRTEAIIVEDPRWPQHAGRMYMRLLERPNGKPVMFVEGMAKDNEYPCQTDAEAALLNHAILKAKAIGAELVISGYAESTVKALGLKTELKHAWQSRFVLTPTPLVEATVAFGPHDWVHTSDSECSPNRDPYHYLGD